MNTQAFLQKMTSVTALSGLHQILTHSIYDLSGYDEDVKAYFKREVLTRIDPTVQFLSSECRTCYKHAVQEKARLRFEPTASSCLHPRLCFSCRKTRSGSKMVSAHSASQQYRRSYKVLTYRGYDAWLEAMHHPSKCNMHSDDTTGMRCSVLAAFYNDCNRDIHWRAEKLVRGFDWHRTRLTREDLRQLRPDLL